MQIDSVALVRQAEGLARLLGWDKAADVFDVVADDLEEWAKMREVLSRELGGRISDSEDVEYALKEVRAALKDEEPPRGGKLHEAGPGTVGALALGSSGAGSKERTDEALVALHRIHALVKNWGPLPNGPIPEDMSPADIVAEVNVALERGRTAIVTPSVVDGGLVDVPWARKPSVVSSDGSGG